MSDHSERIARLEESAKTTAVAIARIDERLQHLPTTAWLNGVAVVALLTVLGAVFGVLPFLAKPWLMEAIRAAVAAPK